MAVLYMTYTSLHTYPAFAARCSLFLLLVMLTHFLKHAHEHRDVVSAFAGIWSCQCIGHVHLGFLRTLTMLKRSRLRQ